MLANSVDDIRKHFPDASNIKYDNFEPYLKEAEAKLKRIIPTGIYAFATTPGIDADKLVIQYWAQRYEVLFAIYKRIPQITAMMSENGLQVHWSDTHRPAQESQIKNIRYSVLEGAHTAIEELIIFLNSKSYTEWNNSDFAKNRNRLLFANADEFSSNYRHIEGSERFFNLLNQHIYRAQLLDIAPIIGADTLTSLIAKVHAGSLSVEERLLVDKCCVYLANISMSKILKTVSEEDMPVSILTPNNQSTREEFSTDLKDMAIVDLKSLQNYVNDLNTPDEAPHSIAPSNSDTTKKTFRA